MATRAFMTSMLVCKSAFCASDAEGGRVEGILIFDDADAGTLEPFDLLDVAVDLVAS